MSIEKQLVLRAGTEQKTGFGFKVDSPLDNRVILKFDPRNDYIDDENNKGKVSIDKTDTSATFIVEDLRHSYVGMIVTIVDNYPATSASATLRLDSKNNSNIVQEWTWTELALTTSIPEAPIKSVSVNSKQLQPTDGNVNIDLSEYATKSDISSVYRYKESLPWDEIQKKTNNTVGDVYNSTTQVEITDEKGVVTIYPAGTNVAWNGTEWDALSGIYEQFISKVDATYFEVNNKQLTISATCPLINKIETIKLNGEELNIQDKSVNIVIPEFNLYWNDITTTTTTTTE